MKRCFSMALTIALLGTMPVSAARAEEAEIVSEAVDTAVAEAVYAGDTGLTVEGADAFAPQQTSEEAIEESPAISITEVIEPDAAFTEGAVLAADNAVQVQEDEDAAENAQSGGLTLSAETLTIGRKEQYDGLTANPQPKAYGMAQPTVTWSSSDEKTVKVDAETGVLTGVRKGTAIITARTDDGEEAVCAVIVKGTPSKVALNPKKLTLSTGMTATLEATLAADRASGALTFTSSKPQVASVDENGSVLALSEGKTTITVTTFNGKSASCAVQVVAAPASLIFPAELISVSIDQEYALGAKALTAKGEETEASIRYAVDPASPDPECLTLDAETGVIIGVRNGEALIRATTQNGLTAGCWVIISAAPKAVRLNASSGVVGVGETYKGLVAETIAPDGEDICASTVRWSTSNAKVATVDAISGAVTGVATGKCTITVETTNGKKATCKVTVKKAPDKISSLQPRNGKLRVGEIGQYKLSLPSGCGGSVTYASSDSSVATVDNAGLVTGIAPGEVTVTATTYNGKTATATLVIVAGDNVVTDNDGETATADTADLTGSKENMSNADKIEYVIAVAQSKLGCPYVYGSFGPDSFDCSGFTTYCYRQVGIELKHSAYTQGYDSSQRQLTMSELRRGDLVFFDTVADSDLSDHSGLYLGSGKFIHASSSGGKVIISDFSKEGTYYNRVFSWGRRVLN